MGNFLHAIKTTLIKTQIHTQANEVFLSQTGSYITHALYSLVYGFIDFTDIEGEPGQCCLSVDFYL